MNTSNISTRQMTVTDATESTFAQTQTQSERISHIEKRMAFGKRLIFIGFVVAVLGIVAYCIVGLSAPARQGAVAGLGLSVGPSLGIIGIGTLLWLVGSYLFLNAAMDRDPDGPEVNL